MGAWNRDRSKFQCVGSRLHGKRRSVKKLSGQLIPAGPLFDEWRVVYCGCELSFFIEFFSPFSILTDET